MHYLILKALKKVPFIDPSTGRELMLQLTRHRLHQLFLLLHFVLLNQRFALTFVFHLLEVGNVPELDPVVVT